MSTGPLLIIVVVLLLIGAPPSWPHSRSLGVLPERSAGIDSPGSLDHAGNRPLVNSTVKAREG